jgi:hypothetical protein
MLNHKSRMWIVGGAWVAAMATIVAYSVAVGARLSTSALLLVICAVPMGVALLIGFGAPSPTVAELLYVVDTKKEGQP